MGLREIPKVRQLSQLAANRGRRQVDEVAALERLRPDGHGARRELLHDRTQDCLLSVLHVVSALCRSECQLEYDQRDLVVQIEPPPGWHHPAVASLDQPSLEQVTQLAIEALW